MNEIASGRVESLAVRTKKNGPMREIAVGAVAQDGGLEGDLPVRAERGLTLLSREQWSDALTDLGCQLPWHTRRANVLVSGIALGPLIGRRIRIGEVELEVIAETEPCALMDRLYDGLRAALEPDCRGGVYGRVCRGGTIRQGDEVVPIE